MARPSRPSVRFTPLDIARIMNSAQTTKITGPIDQPKSVGEGQLGGGRGPPRESREVQRQDREGDADDELAGHLRLGPQAEAALLDDLDVVVEEADQAHAGDQEEHQHAGDGRPLTGDQLGRRVGDQGRQDEGDAAHGGGAALAVVARAGRRPG